MRRIAIVIIIGILIIGGIHGGTSLFIKDFEKNMQQEDEYLNDMTDLFVIAGNSINDIKDLATDSKNTEAWIVQVEKKIMLINQASEEATKLKPPKSLTEIHEIYLSAFEKFELGTKEVSSGIKSKDQKLLVNGVALLDEGMKKFVNGSERLASGN